MYDHAVYQVKLAQRTSTIAGILCHQGQADCPVDRYSFYGEKFTVIMNQLRKDLNLHGIPLLVGRLGDFLGQRDNKCVNYIHVNKALESIATKNPMTGFVSAKGLESNSHKLHFCAKALREFVLIYYEEFKKYEDTNKIFEEKSTMDSAIRSEMELL